jgi:outer membrane immunogenic protein
MRLLVCGLLLAGIASPALAADLDLSWLRGSSAPAADPPTYARWSGFYGGGQVGADFHGMDFRSATDVSTSNIVAQDANLTGIPLNSFSPLSVLNTKGPSFGGFMGYNYQIDDIVTGFELNFNSSAARGGSSGSESRNYYVCATDPGNTNCTTPNISEAANFIVTHSAAASLTDYGSIRARFGWAFENFLPYLLVGVAVSQVDASRSVNVTYSSICGAASPTCIPIGNTPNGITQSDISHGKWIFGFDAGLGIDYALTRHIFLRGEVEYLQLSSVNDVKVNTTSARVGAGLKF